MGVVFAVGGNQPGFDRNSNTGGDIGGEARLVTALQTVFHKGRPFVGMTVGESTRKHAPMWTGMDSRIRGDDGGGWVPAFARTPAGR